MVGQKKLNSAETHVATIQAAIEALEGTQGTYLQRRAKILKALTACDGLLDAFNQDAAPDNKRLVKPFNAAAHCATLQQEVASYERPSGRYLENDTQKLLAYVQEAREHFSNVTLGLQGAFLSPELKNIDMSLALGEELTMKRLHVELLACTLRSADVRTAYVAYGQTGKIDHTPKLGKRP